MPERLNNFLLLKIFNSGFVADKLALIITLVSCPYDRTYYIFDFQVLCFNKKFQQLPFIPFPAWRRLGPKWPASHQKVGNVKTV